MCYSGFFFWEEKLDASHSWSQRLVNLNLGNIWYNSFCLLQLAVVSNKLTFGLINI